ncbi:uncharacterized protein AMSG_00714 [Thecamonas trahens ATCC 50062]|uniref:RanBD1 domain-containing protein n=1 Tax=Thecamonas trahens ATCC 50062 TaxID=461836 RepID=A0A0L0DGU6_THETB|nr:hypothetical protein AMSG_00714 [Thecamonas trahens ATCC 50062]KNC50553.1 hypothetical protein AMSG_00714 [Thecamonas trahens ATCC 50062]|eukprot:XP_013762443.1 hypothetical protein AMSG_00714 [Thecamonas trahens ATCC 50062]
MSDPDPVVASNEAGSEATGGAAESKGKRKAAFQVTRERGFRDDDDEDKPVEYGIQKASAEELAKRKIVRVKYKRPAGAASVPAPSSNPFAGVALKKPTVSAGAANPFAAVNLKKKSGEEGAASSKKRGREDKDEGKAGPSGSGEASESAKKSKPLADPLKKPSFSFARKDSSSSGSKRRSQGKEEPSASEEVVDEHTKDAPSKYNFSFNKAQPKFNFSKSFDAKAVLFGGSAKAAPSVNEHLKSVFANAGSVFGKKIAPPVAKDAAVPLLLKKTQAKVDMSGEALSTGEENETSAFEVKSKAFAFDKEAKEWKTRGVGNLSLNVNKTDQKARFLLRTLGTHQVLINVPIFKGMVVTKLGEKEVRVVTVDPESEPANEPLPLTFRVGHKTSADELLAKIQEIADSMPSKTE